jgi:diadenosine tetraphosphatase ApaH/serine/threonine PP2A family protein phosphatase
MTTQCLAQLQELPTDAAEPYALLADLHGNLEALQEVTAWLDANGVQQAVVLGDLVGYGASPTEVVALVRERGWSALRGNHEEMLLGLDRGARQGMVKERARAAIDWTRQSLDGTSDDYLAALPAAARISDDVVCVHGSLVDPLHCYAYIYDLSLDLNIRSLRQLDGPPGTLVFFGHTHWPKHFRVEGDTWQEMPLEAETSLDRDAEHFLNPGSVGYPRDGDPRASFMVYAPRPRRLHHLRLAYDIETATRKIERAGYHEDIAPRLREAH